MNNAVGCLKEELRRCGSLFMAAADATAVPAGGALAVDREAFSAWITDKVTHHPAIELRREEITRIPAEGTVIIASGPLTSAPLSQEIARLTVITSYSIHYTKLYEHLTRGLGRNGLLRLMDVFGSPEAILATTDKDWIARAGIREAVAKGRPAVDDPSLNQTITRLDNRNNFV